MKTRTVLTLVAFAALITVVPASRGDADIVNCTTISSLPFAITAPGKYCLGGNLTMSGAGPAILIEADDVILDFNGYTMSSTDSFQSGFGSAGTTRHSLTIRNGTLKGFYAATNLLADTSLVEGMRVNNSIWIGISVVGNSNIVRNNQVANTHSDPNSDPGVAIGIRVDGSSNAVLNNDVTETVAGNNAEAHGVYFNASDRTTVENNRVERTSGPAGLTSAIYIANSNNVLAVNNRIIRSTGIGIQYLNSTGTFRDNIAISCPTPYSGGTNGGNNQ